MGVLVTLVEGQSEERAIGVLLRRLMIEVPVVQPARPFRIKRNKIVRPGELERSMLQAVRSRPEASSILVLLDADQDCPAELGSALLARAEADTDLPVGVVCPKCEIEAWILAGIESVRGVRGVRLDAAAPDDVETIGDAKGALTNYMDGDRGYVATDDMPAFFAQLDTDLARGRSPSLDKFMRDIERLCQLP